MGGFEFKFDSGGFEADSGGFRRIRVKFDSGRTNLFDDLADHISDTASIVFQTIFGLGE